MEQQTPKLYLFQSALNYANDVVTKKKNSNKYVRKVCKDYLDFVKDLKSREGQEIELKQYYIDFDKLLEIENLLRKLKYPTGPRRGQKILGGLSGFQSFLFVVYFTTIFKDYDDFGEVKVYRRYTDLNLLIGRKNGKSFKIAILLLILMVTEPNYGEYYSISTESKSARQIFGQMKKIIRISGLEGTDFKMWNDKLMYIPKENIFEPLSRDVRDGSQPSGFVADEVGAFKDDNSINAMVGGQFMLDNKVAIYISTAYENEVPVWSDKINYAKRVIDGTIKDDTLFALLYYADLEEVDLFSDEAIYQANPLAYDLPKIFKEKVAEREKAKNMPSKINYYKVKHLNIFLNNGEDTALLNRDILNKNLIDYKFDWRGKDCILGVDLSESEDNCGFTLTHRDRDNNIFVRSWCFVPKGKVDEKEEREKGTNYRLAIEKGYCIPVGNSIVSYEEIADYIFEEIINKMGVNLICIAYDNKYWSEFVDFVKQKGIDKEEQFHLVDQRNFSADNTVRTIREKFLLGEFKMEKNHLFELNLLNAHIDRNKEGKRAIRKRENAEFNKIDMVAALFMAMHYYVEIERYKPEITWVDTLESLGY